MAPPKMAPEPYTPALIMARMRSHQNRRIRQQQSMERVHLWLARQHFYSAGEHHWRELGMLVTQASKMKGGLISRPRRVDRWSPLFCGECARCCGQDLEEEEEEEEDESSLSLSLPVPMLDPTTAAPSVCETELSLSDEGGLHACLEPVKSLVTLRVQPMSEDSSSAVDIVFDTDEDAEPGEWAFL